ncbi:MAG: hypothetical protein U0822_04805 [Anaerolineae bacterium]
MSDNTMSMPTLCQALMSILTSTISTYAKGKADLAHYGPKTPVEEHLGRHVLGLRNALRTESDFLALEASLRQVQEEILGVLFALIDGSMQPPDWPNEIRLVNMDTGEVICPDSLQWAFGIALAKYRATSSDQEQS